MPATTTASKRPPTKASRREPASEVAIRLDALSLRDDNEPRTCCHLQWSIIRNSIHAHRRKIYIVRSFAHACSASGFVAERAYQNRQVVYIDYMVDSATN